METTFNLKRRSDSGDSTTEEEEKNNTKKQPNPTQPDPTTD